MVNDKLLKEIEEYCELNEVVVGEVLNKSLKDGFTILKYGIVPYREKPNEKAVEVIKEVPVEVIKEVYITDNTKYNEVLEKNDELNKKIETLEVIIKELKIELKKCKDEIINNNSGFDIYGEK